MNSVINRLQTFLNKLLLVLLFILAASTYNFGQLNMISAQQSVNWADYYVQKVLFGTGVEAFNVTISGCDITGGKSI